MTVICSDLVYLYACNRLVNPKQTKEFILVYANLGLVLLDNVHFQYNSMMYGMMILSYVYLNEGKILRSALAYAILLQFKHIYLYSAPAYGIMYLRETLFKKDYKKFMMLAL